MHHFLFRSTIGSQYKKGPANMNHSCPTRIISTPMGFNRFYGYPKTSKEQQVKTHFCSPKFIHTKPIKQTIFLFFGSESQSLSYKWACRPKTEQNIPSWMNLCLEHNYLKLDKSQKAKTLIYKPQLLNGANEPNVIGSFIWMNHAFTHSLSKSTDRQTKTVTNILVITTVHSIDPKPPQKSQIPTHYCITWTKLIIVP